MPADLTAKIDDTVSDTVNDTASNSVKGRLQEIIRMLMNKPGLKSYELALKLRVTEITIRRDMQKLSKLVKLSGAPKSGGYVLTDYTQKKLRVTNSAIRKTNIKKNTADKE